MNIGPSGKKPNPAEEIPKSVSEPITNLFERKTSKSKLSSHGPSATKVQQSSPFQAFKEGCERPYKLIENILRRIAANIGNTPSQTDVKIVSCIPIDVTDLQQRIFNLERQLEEAKMNLDKTTTELRQKAYFSTTSPPMVDFDPMTVLRDSVDKWSDIFPDNLHKCARKIRRSQIRMAEENKKHKNPDIMSRTEFQNIDKPSGGKKRTKPRQKTDAKVYYVQTKARPQPKDLTFKRNRHVQSMADIESSTQTKYASQLLAVFSSSSEYSAPVCRDDTDGMVITSRQPSRDTDLISSVSKFHNLDNDIMNLRNDDHSSSCSKFYDDSLYDLIPVKEKSREIRKNATGRKKRDQFDTRIHESRIQEARIQEARIQEARIQESRIQESRIHYVESNHRVTYKIPEESDFVMNYSYDNPGFPMYHNIRRMEWPKHTASINGSRKYFKKGKNKDASHKFFSCSPTKMINTECQTNSDEVTQSNTTTIMSEAAENTLHEIKETLQTVLETVKTNSRNKCNAENNRVQNTKSEIVDQNLKYMVPPHGTTNPIQLFYTPVPFIGPPFMPPCKHIHPNASKQNDSPKEKQSDSSSPQVNEIWKPEIGDGNNPLKSTTSERDESSLKKESIISNEQPLSEYSTETAERTHVTVSQNSLPYPEDIRTADQTVSSHYTNESEIEEAEYEEDENEYEDIYGDASEVASVGEVNEEYLDENVENEEEPISEFSYVSLKARESIVQPQKNKKKGKLFTKVFGSFFKNKPSKNHKINVKESSRNRKLSKTTVKH